VGSRPALEEHAVIAGLSNFSKHRIGCGLEELDGGGGSVRRRNTLHEVGGRSLNETRVLKARAGSETHTHIIFPLTLTYAHKIIS
jgi:hypothetical protein